MITERRDPCAEVTGRWKPGTLGYAKAKVDKRSKEGRDLKYSWASEEIHDYDD